MDYLFYCSNLLWKNHNLLCEQSHNYFGKSDKLMEQNEGQLREDKNKGPQLPVNQKVFLDGVCAETSSV